MKLNQYPVTIAQASQAVSAIDQQIAELRRDIAYLEDKADLVVAFESTLKNDTQRRARRFEILDANPRYVELQNRLLSLTADKSNAIAHLEFLRSQFSVAMMEARMAIAERLVGLESRELVGL